MIPTTSNSRRSSECCERTNNARSSSMSSRGCAGRQNQREADCDDDCAMEESVQEEVCCVPPPPSPPVCGDEPEEECPRDPRYDAKELRDAVRTLRPFVKLIADSNNPYARLVAQEVCDTYYDLYHPDKQPNDVINSIDCWAKRDQTAQIRTEICRYIPESGVREWVSLRNYVPSPMSEEILDDRREVCVVPVDLFGCNKDPRRREYHQAAGADHQRLDMKADRERLIGSDSAENAGKRREAAGSDDRRCPDTASPINRQTVYYSRNADAPPPPLPRENCPGLSADLLDDSGRDETTSGLVAGAFAKLSVAHREIEKKKAALRQLTENYLYACSAAADEADRQQPSQQNSSGSQVANASLSASAGTPPVLVKPFDPTEYNTNAFRDRDFIRMLPFFAIVHSQLEHVAKKQREQYALNMTDPIMSALHHVAYEIGDPRLKNELAVDHVKLITRNTWQSFFYGMLGKMPVVPLPPIYRPFSPPNAMCSFRPRQQPNRDSTERDGRDNSSW